MLNFSPAIVILKNEFFKICRHGYRALARCKPLLTLEKQLMAAIYGAAARYVCSAASFWLLVIVSCSIRTTSMLGFFVARQNKQRLGGFGQGTFQSPMEQRFYAII